MPRHLAMVPHVETYRVAGGAKHQTIESCSAVMRGRSPAGLCKGRGLGRALAQRRISRGHTVGTPGCATSDRPRAHPAPGRRQAGRVGYAVRGRRTRLGQARGRVWPGAASTSLWQPCARRSTTATSSRIRPAIGASNFRPGTAPKLRRPLDRVRPRGVAACRGHDHPVDRARLPAGAAARECEPARALVSNRTGRRASMTPYAHPHVLGLGDATTAKTSQVALLRSCNGIDRARSAFALRTTLGLSAAPG